MNETSPITTLFLDIGGVLLTNGWDHGARDRAAQRFHLDREAMEQRHRLTFGTYEEGRITLEQYLDRVIFDEKRPFTASEFEEFMHAQSQPYPEMIDLFMRIKTRHGLKVAVVSNEGRELNERRIRRFGLTRLVDAFISSCYIGTRKPDGGMFRLALDIMQTPPGQVLYVENTAMFVAVAEGMGIRAILHTDQASTRARMKEIGLHDETTERP